jgi:hypothetical protein
VKKLEFEKKAHDELEAKLSLLAAENKPQLRKRVESKINIPTRSEIDQQRALEIKKVLQVPIKFFKM